MDRVLVSDAALPQATDILNTNKFGMVAHAFLARAILGVPTAIDGLACNPTTPASLQVTVGVGSIYALDPVDATAYNDLGVDNNQIVKQGILYNPVTLTITPPSTAGYSQVFLVQAILQNIDTGAMVVSYFNPAILTNPLAQPFAGPNNSGQSQFTIRSCACAIALKPGAAAPSGTQATPVPDNGYTGLYAITVTNGQAAITSTNIVQLPNAPFIDPGAKLPQIPTSVLNNKWSYVVDTGTASNLVVTLPVENPAYTAGMGLIVKAAAAPTGPSIINASGLGNRSIIHPNGSATNFREWSVGALLALHFDGTNFQLLAPTFANDLIDTSITFTVHGAGANFTDLNAAFEYLSKLKITHNGAVTLQLAGAVSGIAQQFTYTSSVLMDHPNNGRITILGAPMLGALPTTDAGYAVTGSANRVADTATNLAMLRTKFATELHFSACSGFAIKGEWPCLDQLLLTGDSSTPSLGISGNCYGPPVINIATVGIAIVGFGAGGAYIEGGIWFPGAQLIAIGNGYAGLRILDSHFEPYQNAALFLLQNGLYGMECTLNSNFDLWASSQTCYVECNGTNGIYVNIGSSGYIANGLLTRVYNNGSWGLSAFQGSTVSLGNSCDLTIGNAAGGMTAIDMSFIALNGAISGTESPAIGTVGNNQSLIAYT
jgi:hypothetical protein